MVMTGADFALRGVKMGYFLTLRCGFLDRRVYFGGFGFDRGMKICEYALSASWLTGSLWSFDPFPCCHLSR